MSAMVVVNETSRVPPVDTHGRERLATALDRDGVVGAMLIGSQARGEPRPLSDVDIAVWHAPGLDSAGRFRLRLDLIAAAEAALGTDEIDLIMLNDAPPLLRQRAMGEGIRLLERDREERVRLETKAIIDFCDTAPLREQLGEALRGRIREGTFGRRPSR
jgi:predicted nucleotidyltransferase